MSMLKKKVVPPLVCKGCVNFGKTVVCSKQEYNVSPDYDRMICVEEGIIWVESGPSDELIKLEQRMSSLQAILELNKKKYETNREVLLEEIWTQRNLIVAQREEDNKNV